MRQVGVVGQEPQAAGAEVPGAAVGQDAADLRGAVEQQALAAGLQSARTGAQGSALGQAARSRDSVSVPVPGQVRVKDLEELPAEDNARTRHAPGNAAGAEGPAGLHRFAVTLQEACAVRVNDQTPG